MSFISHASMPVVAIVILGLSFAGCAGPKESVSNTSKNSSVPATKNPVTDSSSRPTAEQLYAHFVSRGPDLDPMLDIAYKCGAEAMAGSKVSDEALQTILTTKVPLERIDEVVSPEDNQILNSEELEIVTRQCFNREQALLPAE